MDLSHPIVSLLAGGVTPTPDEARDLTDLGAFTASIFSRHLHGVDRPPAGTARSGDWATHLSGRLSASTATRWTDGMGLGVAYDEDAWAGYWALASGTREGYWDMGLAPRETVALFEDAEDFGGFGPPAETTPARRRRPSLFGPRGGRPTAPGRRAHLGSSPRRPASHPGTSTEPLRWADGSPVHGEALEALAAGGLGVSDQVSGEAAAGALSGPRRGGRLGASLRLDSLLVDNRTPALRAALSLADEALAPAPAAAGAFALSAARAGRTLGQGAPAGGPWAAPSGGSRARFFSFFDAVEGDFLALTPEQAPQELGGLPRQDTAAPAVHRRAGAPQSPGPRPSAKTPAARMDRSEPAMGRTPRSGAAPHSAARRLGEPAVGQAAAGPVSQTPSGLVRLSDVTPRRGAAVRPWTRDNTRDATLDKTGTRLSGLGRGRLAPEVVRDAGGAPMPRQHRAGAAAPAVWSLPLSAASSGGALTVPQAPSAGRAASTPMLPLASAPSGGAATLTAAPDPFAADPFGTGPTATGPAATGPTATGPTATGPAARPLTTSFQSVDVSPERRGHGRPRDPGEAWLAPFGAGVWSALDQGPPLPLASTLTGAELLAGDVATRRAAPVAGSEQFRPVVARAAGGSGTSRTPAGWAEALDGVAWVVLPAAEGDSPVELVGATARSGLGRGLERLPLAAVPAGRLATMVPAAVALLASRGGGADGAGSARTLAAPTRPDVVGGAPLARRSAGADTAAGPSAALPLAGLPVARDLRAAELSAASGAASEQPAGELGIASRHGARLGATPWSGLQSDVAASGLTSAAALGLALESWAGSLSSAGATSRGQHPEGVARRATVGAYGALTGGDVAGDLVALAATWDPRTEAGLAGASAQALRGSALRSAVGPSGGSEPARDDVDGLPAWSGRRAPAVAGAGGAALRAQGQGRWGSSSRWSREARRVAAGARTALHRPVVTSRESRAAVALLHSAGPLVAAVGGGAPGPAGAARALRADSGLAPVLSRQLGASSARDVRVARGFAEAGGLADSVGMLRSLGGEARRAAAGYLRRAGWSEADLEVLRLGAAAAEEPLGGAVAQREPSAGGGVAELSDRGREGLGGHPRTQVVSGLGGAEPSAADGAAGEERAARRMSSNLARVLAGTEATALSAVEGRSASPVSDVVGGAADPSSLLRRPQDAYFGSLGVSGRATQEGVDRTARGARGTGSLSGQQPAARADWLLMDLLSFAGADERTLDVAEAVLPPSVRRRVMARVEALGLGADAPAASRRRGYARVFEELGLVDLGAAEAGEGGGQRLEGRIGGALQAVAEGAVGRRAQPPGAFARAAEGGVGLRPGAGALAVQEGARLDPTLGRTFAPEQVLRGLVGRPKLAGASRLARLGGAGVLARTGVDGDGQAIDASAHGGAGAIGAGPTAQTVTAWRPGRGASRPSATGRRATSGPAVARELLGLAGARRRGADGRLGRLLARLGRKESTSVFGRADSADFALAWLGRVDGSRSGFDLGLEGERGALDATFGVDRGMLGRAAAQGAGRGARSSVATESPVGEADLVSPRGGEASGSPQSDRSGLRRLLRSEHAAAGVSRASRGQGASAAMRGVDWRYVETGSSATPAANVDYGKLAAAAVGELGSSRVSLPYVAPAVKAVAQSALLEPKTAPAEGPGSAPAQQGSAGGKRDAAGGGDKPTLSKAAMKKLAVEMADRVARLLQREKERRGKWA